MEAVLFAVSRQELTDIVTDAVQKVLAAQNKPQEKESDRWFNLSELCAYLPDKPSKVTIYRYVAENKIPYHKSRKKLRFLKSEIDAWLLQ